MANSRKNNWGDRDYARVFLLAVFTLAFLFYKYPKEFYLYSIICAALMVFGFFIVSELKKRHVSEIEKDISQVAISAISVWEGILLAEKKKLSCDKNEFIKITKEASLKIGIREIPITSEISILSRELEFSHQDPADRFICATAHALKATLYTRDKEILRLKWLSTKAI